VTHVYERAHARSSRPAAGGTDPRRPACASSYLRGQAALNLAPNRSAAGACLAFFTHITVGGRQQTAVGVVLGQWEAGSSSAILAAAGRAAEQLVGSIAPTSTVPTVTPPSATGGQGRAPDGESRPGLSRRGAPAA
jgi:hypothetical protein